jgi:hypothetical protein
VEHMGGKGANTHIMAHCRREALHAQWEVLLDDEFLQAYKSGIVITCCDGVIRRFYPRIFTYSADYPEKYVESSWDPFSYSSLLQNPPGLHS